MIIMIVALCVVGVVGVGLFVAHWAIHTPFEGRQ